MTDPSYEQLLLELRHLREQLAERDRVIARLEATVRDLQGRLSAAEKDILARWATGGAPRGTTPMPAAPKYA